jgi:hypothetical protein
MPLPRRRAAQTFYKTASVLVRSAVERASPAKVAKVMYGDDLEFDEIQRAASSPALLNDSGSGWAGPLGRYAVSQAIEDVVAMSAIGRLLQIGALHVDLGRIASLTIPGRQTSAADAGTWLAEGAVSQVRKYTVLGPKLVPHKLEVTTSMTFEMTRASNIEEILRVLLSEAASLAVDAAVLSTTAASPARSAGLLYGLTPLAASTTGGFDSCGSDLGKLVADIASRGGGARAAFIAAPSQATAIRFWAGGQFGTTAANDVLPVAASAALADGTVICIEPESFACTFGELQFSMSQDSLLHFEDTSPADITSGTGTLATPVKSLFQTDSLAIKMTLWGDWVMRAPHVSYIDGCAMVDREKLAEMRAYTAEIREDLERRQLEDPFLDAPQMRSAPPVVFKTRDNANAYAAAEPLNTDDIADAVAEALAEEGDEIRREFEARIAKLEGQIETLLSVLGSDPSRAKAVRKGLQHNGSQLIEGSTARS